MAFGYPTLAKAGLEMLTRAPAAEQHLRDFHAVTLRPGVAQGGDVGAYVTDMLGRQAPDGLAGIHLNLLLTALVGPPPAEPAEAERAALDAIATFRASGSGYFIEQATRPQTIGYALLDSPVALAAWMLDHDTDAYYKISRAFLDKQPSGNLRHV